MMILNDDDYEQIHPHHRSLFASFAPLHSPLSHYSRACLPLQEGKGEELFFASNKLALLFAFLL